MIYGYLPAAGEAKRMFGLPKFLLPTPTGSLIANHARQMVIMGQVNKVIVGLQSEYRKCLANQLPENSGIINIDTNDPITTLSLISRFNRNEAGIMGFPDTYFEDHHVYAKLTAALDDGYSFAVGLWVAREDQKKRLGMVSFAPNKILGIIDKPNETSLSFAWGALAWTSEIWQYFHSERGLIGDAIENAIAAGVHVKPVFMDGQYWDCGTPQEYFDLVKTF